MGYKMKSSGLPFKELGSSPAKQGMKAEMRELTRTKETEKPKSMSVSDFDETTAKAAVKGAASGGATKKQQLNPDGHPTNPTVAQKEERAHFEKNSEPARKKSTGRKIKEFLHGGEENLGKKEEVSAARKDRQKRGAAARHTNKLARINKPTRSERRKSKRENTSE